MTGRQDFQLAELGAFLKARRTELDVIADVLRLDPDQRQYAFELAHASIVKSDRARTCSTGASGNRI